MPAARAARRPPARPRPPSPTTCGAEPVRHLAGEVDSDEAVDGDAGHGEGGDDAVRVEEEGEGDAHVVPEHVQKVSMGKSAIVSSI